MRWLDSALEYVADGCAVVPLYGMHGGQCACTKPDCASPGKHPVTLRGVSEASADPDQVRAWAEAGAEFPHVNLGVALPDGVAVIDVDPRNGGWEGLAALEAHFGALPTDRVTVSGSEGLHFWVRVPEGSALPGKLAPGVDVKQRGGYVLGAGSSHKSGGTYRWQTKGALPPCPGWIEQRKRGEISERPEIKGTDVDPLKIAALAEAVAPLCVDGQKHHLCWELGSWLAGRGWSGDSIEQLIRMLPVRDVAARVKGALDGTQYAGGWSRLKERFGAQAEHLDRVVPDPAHGNIQDLIATAAEYMPRIELPTPETPGFDPYWGLGPPLAATVEIKPLAQLVRGLDIVPGYRTILHGKPSASKSPTALALGLAIANGTPWLGRETIRSAVVYLAYEKPEGTNRKRTRIARAMGVNPDALIFHDMRKHPLTTPGVPERIAARAATVSGGRMPSLVIVDTYGSAVQGVPHIDAEYATPLAHLSNLVTDDGGAIMPLLHCRKGKVGEVPTLDDVEGSTYLVAAVDAAIGLYRADGEDPFTISVASTRPIEDGFETFRLRWANVEFDSDPRWGLGMIEPESAAESAEATQRRLSTDARVDLGLDRVRSYVQSGALQGVITHADLAAVTRADRAISDRAIAAAVRHGVLVRDSNVGGIPRYRVPARAETH